MSSVLFNITNSRHCPMYIDMFVCMTYTCCCQKKQICDIDVISALTCTKPSVTDGTVNCATTAGASTDTPGVTDTCSVTCDNGFSSSNPSSTTCTLTGNTVAFGEQLSCQRKWQIFVQT